MKELKLKVRDLNRVVIKKQPEWTPELWYYTEQRNFLYLSLESILYCRNRIFDSLRNPRMFS